MKLLSFLVLFIVLSSNIFSQIVAGYYYSNYTAYPHASIDYSKITHIVHAFIRPNSNGTIGTDSWFLYPALIEEAHKHGVKVVVAAGGYGNSDGFKPMCADPKTRSAFIKNLVDFCLKHGYDGADMDWEYPKADDKANFVALIKEMREAFNTAGLTYISAALPSTDWSGGYDIAQLKDLMDWFGIMTYDFYGPWENNSGHNSPLYSSGTQYYAADRSLQEYLNKGVPKQKLLIGMAFYGYNFKTSGLYQPISKSESTSISYNNANNLISQGWNYLWDETCKVPYLQDAGRTRVVVYDDTTSIKLKSEYVRKNGLGGTIIWKLGFDHNAGKVPLLNMIGKYLLNYPSEVPPAPSLLEPLNDYATDQTIVTLKWNPSDNTTSYNIQLDTTEVFTKPLIYKKGISINSYRVTSLKKGKDYFWRIAPVNLNGEGSFSEVRKFRVNATTDIVDLFGDSIPQEYKIENYPNPFNPATKVRINVPETGMISLKVFNVLGQEVLTLINEEKAAGVYEVQFDASSLPGGTYICYLTAGTYSKGIKMMLLK